MPYGRENVGSEVKAFNVQPYESWDCKTEGIGGLADSACSAFRS